MSQASAGTSAAELGERVALSLRAENLGLLSQRLEAIRSRLPASGWYFEREPFPERRTFVRVHFGPDGKASPPTGPA